MAYPAGDQNEADAVVVIVFVVVVVEPIADPE